MKCSSQLHSADLRCTPLWQQRTVLKTIKQEKRTADRQPAACRLLSLLTWNHYYYI